MFGFGSLGVFDGSWCTANEFEQRVFLEEYHLFLYLALGEKLAR